VNLYCMENHRTAEQLAEMRRLEAEGLCLFCPDGLRRQARQRVLFQTRHWTVTPNEFPYAGTSLHLLLVPQQHVGDVLDLGPDAQADFWTALAQIRERYGLRYYGLGMRNGDCRFTGATIAHLHAHVLVGDPAADPGVHVRMRFASRPSHEFESSSDHSPVPGG
jgi:ATP adenylyltransferase